MRFAILADDYASFVMPMAQGLSRMFARIGVDSQIFYHGLRWLTFNDPTYAPQQSVSFKLKTLVQRLLVYPYLMRLASYDAVIVVNHVPTAYMRHFRVENIRRLFPGKAVVLYELVYLPTLGAWATSLREGNPRRGIPEGGHYNVERYDWYLLASVATEYPLAKGVAHPYSLIGLDLDDGSLYPQEQEFAALVDFERPDNIDERAIQLQALEETQTPYTVLSGHYPLSEIREIYRRCSIYFVAHRESFGLPICELQLCGSYVFTPYARWCPAHWIKEDLTRPGPGRLSSNFIVYDNDLEELKRQIEAVKRSYNPQAVIDTLRSCQPHLVHGDTEQLRQFVEMVRAGKITSRSHLQYADWPIVTRWDQNA